jgi:recombination protein RecT
MANTNTPAAKGKAELQKINKEIVDQVMEKIKVLEQSNTLNLPPEYSAGNALKSAELVLLEATDKSGKPVLESCTKASIGQALLRMVISGLSPIKQQCYFIPFGSKLTFLPSYNGRIAWAERIGLKRISANVIYEGDDFSYAIDPETGLKKVTKHEQSFANIDMNKIIGAYATYEMENGYKDVEVMTMLQIKKAWLQGAAKGNSPAHSNFSDQMARKTVLGRACSAIINRSTDAYLEGDPDEQKTDTSDEKPKENSESLSFDEAEVINDDPPKQTEPKAEPKQDDKQGIDAAAAEFEQQEYEKQQKEAEKKQQKEAPKTDGRLPNF